MDIESLAPPGGDLRGRVALVDDSSTNGLSALREYAPLADPIVCSSEDELFDMLDNGDAALAFLSVDGDRCRSLAESYRVMTTRDVCVIAEHVHRSSGVRYFVLAAGQWRRDSLTVEPGAKLGSIRLDTPILGQGKTSVVMELPDRPGSLVRALGAISRRHLNLSKLEMRPSSGHYAQCTVIVDIDGYANRSPVREAIDELNRLATTVHVLGAYPAAMS
jgi:prephenate dehydratase